MTDIKNNRTNNMKKKNIYKLNGGALVFVKEKYAHEFTIPDTKPITTNYMNITDAIKSVKLRRKNLS